MFHKIIPVLILLVSISYARPVLAEVSGCKRIDSLPITIAKSGAYCLKRDLSVAITERAAIRIKADDVTLDCNNYMIDGLPGGPKTKAIGIVASSRQNVTIRNCTIQGFNTGISLNGSNDGYHVIENNRLSFTTTVGISVLTGRSVVRNNNVYDTGGSKSIPIGILGKDNVDIINNTVAGVIARAGSNLAAIGIMISSDGDVGREVSSNRISRVLPDGAGLQYGIDVRPKRSIIRDNSVISSRMAHFGDIGIRCLDHTAVSRDNVVADFSTSIKNCASFFDSSH